MPKMNSQFSSEEIRTMCCDMYLSGSTIKEIAKIINRSFKTISKILKDNNIKIRDYNTKNYTISQEKEICNLYKNRFTLKYIAKLFNITETPVRRILKENNVPIRTYSETYGTNFTTEQIQNICDMYIRGMSINNIANILEYTGYSILTTLKGNNIKIRTYSESNAKKVRFSQYQEKEICNLYKNESSLRYIANKLNVSGSVITKVLNENNIKIREKLQFTPEEIKKICDMYLNGSYPIEIGKIFSVSGTPIMRILKENNIKTRSYSESCKLRDHSEHEKEICEMYINNISVLKISKKFKFGGKKVRKILLKNNIKLRNKIESIKLNIGCIRREFISEDIQKICRMYVDGLTYVDIGEEFNISKSVVRKILKKNNIKIRHVPESIISSDIEIKLCEMYKNKTTFDEISKTLRIPGSVIKRTLKKNNIKIRTISEACKGRKTWNKKEISPEIEIKICNMYKDGYIIYDLCKEFNTNVSKILKKNNIKIRTNSDYKSGENSPFWQGGTSFGIYCPKFNNSKREEVRNKYHRKCIICGKDEKDNKTKKGKNIGRIIRLHVHHIDYNKLQGCEDHEWRLAPLCLQCHSKTGYNRTFWENKIKGILSEFDIHNNIGNFFRYLYIL